MQIEDDIKIAEPSKEHYDAYLNACQKMHTYLTDNTIVDPVGKRESQGFIFAQEDFQCRSMDEFATKVVDLYKTKRENLGKDGSAIQSMKRKDCPEFFYFVMKGNEIIGSVNARPQPRDNADIDNNLKSYKNWDYLSPSGVRVTTSTVLLPEYRGKGYMGKAEKQFFDNLRKLGIEEITATVETDNAPSQKTQDKLIENYGGKKYNINGENPETKEVKSYTRYMINTDTSGKEKHLYHDEKADKIDSNKIEKIKELRGLSEVSKFPRKPESISGKELQGINLVSLLNSKRRD